MRETPWRKQFGSDAHAKQQGRIVVTRRGSRILVSTPYNEQFRIGARMILGAAWRTKVQMWSFPQTELHDVRDLIDRIFGVQHVPVWMARKGSGV